MVMLMDECEYFCAMKFAFIWRMEWKMSSTGCWLMRYHSEKGSDGLKVGTIALWQISNHGVWCVWCDWLAWPHCIIIVALSFKYNLQCWQFFHYSLQQQVTLLLPVPFPVEHLNLYKLDEINLHSIQCGHSVHLTKENYRFKIFS
jgi:hypothetical protein